MTLQPAQLPLEELKDLSRILPSARGSPSRWRGFSVAVVGTTILALVASVLLNVLVDPYSVFHVGGLREASTANERYNKMEHLLTHPNDFDAYLVGSSRMGLFDARVADALRPGRRYYNLAVFGGQATDALKMLSTLRRQGIAVREVVMGIDLFPFFRPEGELTPAYRHHPAVTGQSRPSFYLGYLFAPSVYHALQKVKESRTPVPWAAFDYRGRGGYSMPLCDRQIAEEPKGYIARSFSGKPRPRLDVAWRTDALDDLARLVAWLKAEGVDARFFLHPNHRLAHADFTERSLRDFESRVRAVTGPVPSFLWRREWSGDDRLFYDENHYRPVLANEILREVFSFQSSPAVATREGGGGRLGVELPRRIATRSAPEETP